MDGGYSVVLFYKYSLPSEFRWIQTNQRRFERLLLTFMEDACARLELKGRLLIAAEGINGTLSAADRERISLFISTIESFSIASVDSELKGYVGEESHLLLLFSNIDWKHSSSAFEPFPDMKITIKSEIVSSGNAVSVEELEEMSGQHLGPEEFHCMIRDDPDVVLVDVRNPIEYEIGHFVNPFTSEPAVNPEMVTFASFDSGFCARRADELKNKKVLMYCTGGIRCEKASVMLKKHGVRNVSQLRGGIHRYLEQYGDQGYFKGLNFVFDRRVAMSGAETKVSDDQRLCRDVIGKCYECHAPYEEVSGGIICTVCRDVCLICHDCQLKLREYHCRRHAAWKSCYFTFLEVFDRNQLEVQRQTLIKFRDQLSSTRGRLKNQRRTLSRQIEKLTQRIHDLDMHQATVDLEAPRRCRSCSKPTAECNGCCWGFWKAKCGNIPS